MSRCTCTKCKGKVVIDTGPPFPVLSARLFGRFALARSVLPVAEPGTEWRRYTVTYPNGYSFCYAWETVCLVWHSLLVNGWQPHEITVTMGWK